MLDGQLFDFVQKSWNTVPVEKCWQTCKKEKRDIFIDEGVKMIFNIDDKKVEVSMLIRSKIKT